MKYNHFTLSSRRKMLILWSTLTTTFYVKYDADPIDLYLKRKRA